MSIGRIFLVDSPSVKGPQLLRIAHVGLDSIFNVLGLCLRVLNQGLQLPECADFSVSSFVLIAHSFPS